MHLCSLLIPSLRSTASRFTTSYKTCCHYFHRASVSNVYSIIDNLGNVYESHSILPAINCPPYAKTGKVPKSSSKSIIKDKDELEKMRKACEIACRILSAVGKIIKPGLTTEDIDYFVHYATQTLGAYPSPLNYKGFPKSVCTSVNNIACHGIPNDRPLEDGDIVSVDVSAYYQGFHGDTCSTFPVGNVDTDGQNLVDVTKKCLESAISCCGPGVRYNKIGKTISSVAIEAGFSVCPVFVGHGVGKEFHCLPQILHYHNNYPGRMAHGCTFTIEPILCEKSPEMEILEDGWTAITVDDCRAAQFEHTLRITEDGVEILTDSTKFKDDNPEDLIRNFVCP